jgi:histidinol-phosphate/aromatic aminotransferase/cobyric acid decarboxylase-like protein
VFSAKRFLTDKLLKIDSLEVSYSHANFILVEVGDAAKWRSLLMAKGMVVRDCTSFGLPGYIRIGIRPMPDCQRLAAAVADVAASISRLGLDEKSPGT